MDSKLASKKEIDILVVLVNILYETALSLEADQTVCVESNFEMLAFNDSTAISLESSHDQLFEALGWFYDLQQHQNSGSLAGLLCHKVKTKSGADSYVVQVHNGSNAGQPARTFSLVHQDMLLTFNLV